MKLVLLLPLLILSTACSQVNELGVLDKSESRIIGGELAVQGDYISRSSVAIEWLYDDAEGNPRISLCSGVLISSRVVLTAAHCIQKSGRTTKSHKVLVGLNIKTALPLEVEKAIVNEEYEGGNPYDVGAIILKDSALTYLTPAPVAFERRQDKGDLLTISGYGLESLTENISGRLKSALVVVHGMTSDGVILTKQTETAAGASGDSGGALWRMTKGRPHVVGINSAKGKDHAKDWLLIATTGKNAYFIETMMDDYP